MKTIAVDVDDVTLDLVPNWLNYYNKDFSDNLKKEDILTWDISKYVKPEAKKEIYHYTKKGEVFKTARPIIGAIKGIKEIKSWGYRIIFVTAGNPMNAKYEWLCKYDVLADKKDFVVAEDKSLIIADVILDDRWENVVKFKGKSFLMDAPWNRQYDTLHRVLNWNDFIMKLRNDIR